MLQPWPLPDFSVQRVAEFSCIIINESFYTPFSLRSVPFRSVSVLAPFRLDRNANARTLERSFDDLERKLFIDEYCILEGHVVAPVTASRLQTAHKCTYMY